MLSSEEALHKLFDLVKPLGKETVTIANASGRILRDDCAAKHPQPSFSMSAMDGYALASKDIKPNAKLKVIGESAAGHPSQEKINSGGTKKSTESISSKGNVGVAKRSGNKMIMG